MHLATNSAESCIKGFVFTDAPVKLCDTVSAATPAAWYSHLVWKTPFGVEDSSYIKHMSCINASSGQNQLVFVLLCVAHSLAVMKLEQHVL